jgi:hypothetical protein
MNNAPTQYRLPVTDWNEGEPFVKLATPGKVTMPDSAPIGGRKETLHFHTSEVLEETVELVA